MEQWRELTEFPGYSVSDYGRVRNDDTDRLIATSRTLTGHCFVGLMWNGRQVKRALAKLVLEEFGTRPSRRFNTPIHLDADLFNCSAANLAWRPRWFAQQYRRQFSQPQPKHAPIRDIATGEVSDDCWIFVVRYGLLYSDIIESTVNRTYTFGSPQRFEWAD